MSRLVALGLGLSDKLGLSVSRTSRIQFIEPQAKTESPLPGCYHLRVPRHWVFKSVLLSGL